jgi:hydrogenase-1 operon protein HyaE
MSAHAASAPPPRMTQAGLRARLLALGYREVEAGQLDALAQNIPLLIALPLDNPERFPELADIAVILPEVLRQFPPGSFQVTFGSPASSLALCRRFSVYRHPALIFFRRGAYVGTLEGLRDWNEYSREFAAILGNTASGGQPKEQT